jgi:hypothetical protein
MNPQVCDSNGRYRSQSEPILTVPEVCAFLREMDKKKGALLTDIKKLNVSQLIYVVDARLPRNEFDWAIENVNFTQANWGGAYSSVRYLMERATNGKDPYTDYSFAEILKEGGICMDQAYYACNTGKCRGIPTAYVTGDGDRGPHAWMVNLVDATNWVQTNSYGYNSGRFSNPCSGRVQHESVLLNQSAKTTDAKLAPAADAMILGDYLVRAGTTKLSRNTVRYVTEAFPELTASWAHYIKVLGHDEKNLPPTSVWRKVDTDLNLNTLTVFDRNARTVYSSSLDVNHPIRLAGGAESMTFGDNILFIKAGEKLFRISAGGDSITAAAISRDTLEILPRSGDDLLVCTPAYAVRLDKNDFATP